MRREPWASARKCSVTTWELINKDLRAGRSWSVERPKLKARLLWGERVAAGKCMSDPGRSALTNLGAHAAFHVHAGSAPQGALRCNLALQRLRRWLN